jgi:hypothetical protein
MTKFRITTKVVTIDLNDPENEVILKAKERADDIMEWAKMFHQASLVFLVIELILVFTPYDRAYWVSIGMWLVTFVMAQLLKYIAVNHLKNTIQRNMPSE